MIVIMNKFAIKLLHLYKKTLPIKKTICFKINFRIEEGKYLNKKFKLIKIKKKNNLLRLDKQYKIILNFYKINKKKWYLIQ